MRAAIIENEIVVNVVLVDDLDALPGLIDGAGASIGDTWDGTSFNTPAAPVVTPSSVTMRQAKLALRRAGMLAAIDAAVAAMPGDEGDDARIEWQYGKDVERSSPLVASMMPMVGATPSQIDELFILAATL